MCAVPIADGALEFPHGDWPEMGARIVYVQGEITQKMDERGGAKNNQNAAFGVQGNGQSDGPEDK